MCHSTDSTAATTISRNDGPLKDVGGEMMNFVYGQWQIFIRRNKYSSTQLFIMPRSRFGNTLYFDITLTPNGCDCVVISLDISFYASVAFRLHFSMLN